MRRLVLLLVLCGVSGCSVNQAIMADSLTTAYGIEKGHGAEGNPILPKGAYSAAAVSAGLKYTALHFAKKYGHCKTVAKSIYSTSLGAAASNMAVIGGSGDAPAVGVATGVGAYKFGANSAASKYCK